jgi:hypothetical protein
MEVRKEYGDDKNRMALEILHLRGHALMLLCMTICLIGVVIVMVVVK